MMNVFVDERMIKALMYVMYMTVGSVFDQVEYLFDGCLETFKKSYETIATTNTQLEEMAMKYLEKNLKRGLEIDPSYEKVYSYIIYDRPKQKGTITFCNSRLKLELSITEKGKGTEITYQEEIYKKRKTPFISSKSEHR